ncbi:MAG: branched-chain amino acid ABC transporter permease [Beijerinckiaceae bacterium]|nr:branched-chain amino acid ABC transporter permease [Beijerinckiaceae bacterium]
MSELTDTAALAPAPQLQGKQQIWERALIFAGIAFLVAAPLLGVYPVNLMTLMCFALFAAAFNLLIGYVGLLSFGHAAFFGTGAYVSGYAAKAWGWTPELALLAGALSGAFLGLIVGFLAIKRKGIYFSMITLALSQMVFFIALQAPFTGGEDGLQSIPRGKLFGVIDLANTNAMYAFVLVIFLAGVFALWRIVHSPFGQILKAIREHEPRSISLGYDVSRYKLIAFVISCTVTGVAGGLKALVTQIASLTDITWQTSGEVVLMTILGGIGTTLGPLVGAGIVKTLEDHLASLGFPVPVLIGAIFVACVLLFRRGIIGEIENWMKR